MSNLYTCAFLLLLSLICYSLKRTPKLPPGPRGLPIVGNMYQIPRNPWKQFKEWHRVYGPIFRLRIGQTTVILIGNHQVAKEILGKRSALYSSRPRLIVAGECVAKGLDAGLLPYGPKWKQFHAIQASFLNARRCQTYRPLQDVESRHLVFNLLSTNDFQHELYRYASSFMFALLYGRRLVGGDEPELDQMERLITAVFDTTALGNWWVDAFPMLNCLPRPLARWKLVGDDLHRQQTRLYGSNFDDALNAASWNWCKQGVSDEASSCREELPFVLGDLYGAGSRTTAGALRVAVLACVSYPDAMRRAQEELDSTVGSGRLPTFDDVPDLPYVRSFIEEVLRWRPLTPSGVAHSPTSDDEYGGFFIPRGATVLAANWSLEMDQDVFRSPEAFMPERWIDADLPLAAFGFGKRTCPGQHLARNSLLLTVPRLLWAFDIKWKQGQAARLDCLPMTQEGIFSKPGPFEATFTIRSPAHGHVVTREWQDSDDDVEKMLNAIGRQF
ncbi:hypothetical protein G6O67_005444 [Ophiocordyceps sinensis]|uniref:Cytochrome P450 n=2 Tax=Ophiocordyceps sinensis TaxID=72228 RepID=A0A8H4V5W9_9HYPO|nr:cytochrome P450 monooxygenase [Ophiocordyceps sinensis CO18]KAF4509148.1 hypothetical protein G6O67_005444 [Ophiocordyceps sinensis]